MDIFLKNINDRTTSTHLEKYLRKEMRPFGIRALHCQKLKGKSCAIVTVLDVKQGEAFLKAHAGKQSRLFLFQKLYCDRGKQTPDKNLLRALEKDMKDVKVKEEKSNGVKIKLRAPILQADRQVLFAHLSVGVWNYPEGGQLQYVPHYQDHRTGRAMFGHNTLALILNAATSRPGDSAMRVDIRYSTIVSTIFCSRSSPSQQQVVSLAINLLPTELDHYWERESTLHRLDFVRGSSTIPSSRS